IPGIGTCCQLLPPLVLTPATSPRAPPLDQRSCCQIPTTLLGLVGFTSIHGSTSLFRKTVPDWLATASAVQPRNALTPETWTSGPGVSGPAAAGAIAARASPRQVTKPRKARRRTTVPRGIPDDGDLLMAALGDRETTCRPNRMAPLLRGPGDAPDAPAAHRV